MEAGKVSGKAMKEWEYDCVGHLPSDVRVKGSRSSYTGRCIQIL
jgi:hypothetical protein